MNEKEKNEIKEMLESQFSKEEILDMQEKTYKLNILIAIRDTNNSTDYDVLARRLYEYKNKILPLDETKVIVEKYYPLLKEEGMIQEDGKLTAEAFDVATQYDTMLNDELGDKAEKALRAVKSPQKGVVYKTLDGASFGTFRMNKGDKMLCVSNKEFTMALDNYDGTFEKVHGMYVVIDNDPEQKVRLNYLEYCEATKEKRPLKRNYDKDIEKMELEQKRAEYIASRMKPRDVNILEQMTLRMRFNTPTTREERRAYEKAVKRFEKLQKEAKRKIK